MAGIISIGGLATGLDTNEIIDKLVALERRPLDRLEEQQDAVEATKTAIGSVGTQLAALRTAAGKLSSVAKFLARTASSSDETVLKAAAGSGAAPGTTTLTVTQLARGAVATSTVGVASATSTVAAGAGSFQFQVGSGAVQSVAVTGTTTLEQLASAINDLDAGVTATAVNLGTSAVPDYRLQIASTATGADQTIAIVRDDTSLAIQSTQAGLDAEFTVSGFADTFSRSTNSFSDVLPGVTISLRDEGTATITVEDDPDAIVEQVKGLVTAFNALRTFVSGESEVTQEEQGEDVTVGSLATDTSAQRLIARFQDLFARQLTGAETKYVNGSSVGLATQRDGTIALDEAKLRAALADDATAVAQVFAGNGTGEGIANALTDLVDDATGVGGLLAGRTSAIDQQLAALEDQIEIVEFRVQAFAENLELQFAALESLVGGLQQQSAYLAQALG
jgi:flagellar hook-associated protein 2